MTIRNRLGLTTLAVVAIDAVTKFAVTTADSVRRLPGVLPIQNSGYLLGAGSRFSPAAISTGLLALVAIVVVRRVRAGRISPLPAGLVLGGCIANTAERLLRGSVTDFIETPWLVIDIADVAVLTGLIALVGAATQGMVKRRIPIRIAGPRTASYDPATHAAPRGSS